MSVETVELGGIRLHVLAAYPGLPGEGDRVHRTLQRLDPAIVLGDLDTDDALRVRAALGEKKGVYEPSFIDGLFADEARRRFAPEATPGEHPLMAAARLARDKRLDFVPVRPLAPRPGFFARSRARKAAAAAPAGTPEEWPEAFADAMQKAEAWDPASEVDQAHRRVARALADGRAPVVAVVQAHRARRYLDAARSMRRVPV